VIVIIQKLTYRIFILLLTAGITSCTYPKNLTGTYRSNFTCTGVPMTMIKLKPDSTFEYLIKGDQVHDSAEGRFQISGNRLFLSSIWEKTGAYRWTRLEREPKIFKPGPDSMEYQAIYFLGNRKLFKGNFETGKKITSVVVYEERRKFIFFRTHHHKKRWYLKQIE
jgi:hypothetical protein